MAAKFGQQPIKTESTRKLRISRSGSGANLLRAAINAAKSSTVSVEWDWHATIKVCLIHATNAAERDFQRYQAFSEATGMELQSELVNLFAADLANISPIPGELLNHKLWSEIDSPPRPSLILDGNEVAIEAIEITHSLKSDFWRDWYQGFIDGRPMNWDLQKQVALNVTDADWDAGPQQVAQRIAEIRSKWELEQEIGRLKEQLSQAKQHTVAHRKHNQPPPLDDDPGVTAKMITLLWDDLNALEAEIAIPDVEPSVIQQIALNLWGIALKIAQYCGGKIDTTLDAAAKEFGSTGTRWVIGSGAAYWISTQEGAQSVARLAWQYAEKLLAGG